MTKALFISFIFISTNTFGQGLFDGFLKGKGNNDLAFSGTYQRSDQYFAGYNPINYRRKLTIFNLFTEYGVTDRFDVIGSIPMINYKFQDISIGAKYAIVKKEFKKSKLTILPAVAFSTPLSNYQTDIGAAIGQKATTLQFRGIFQYQYKNFFAQTQGGYQYTVDPVPSSIVYSGKIGYMYKKLYIDAWYDQQIGIGNKDYQGSVAYDSFRELVVSHQRIGGVVYYQTLDKFGFFINGSYIFKGRNTGKSYSIGAGLVWKFKKK